MRRFRVDAAQAGGVPGYDGQLEAIAADGGGVDPGDFFANGEVVDQEPGFEVVRAVHDEVDVFQQILAYEAGAPVNMINPQVLTR